MKRSYLTPKAHVRECKIGKGIFAVERIGKGEVVIDFTTGPGIYLPLLEAQKHEEAGNHFIIQVSETTFLAAVNGPESTDYVNHSCEPTCGVRGLVTFVAMRDIPPGEEITFDYAMTESFWMYRMECDCGTPSCRGAVTGNDWKKRTLRKKYRGYFSDYIEKKIHRNFLHQLLLDIYWPLRRFFRQ